MTEVFAIAGAISGAVVIAHAAALLTEFFRVLAR